MNLVSTRVWFEYRETRPGGPYTGFPKSASM